MNFDSTQAEAKAKRDAKKAAKGKPISKKKSKEKKGYLFLTAGGQLFDNRNLLRELELAAERAEIEGGCNFTVLRHTFASWLTMKGVSLHMISKFLGHSSVTTTEKHYAALVPETLHEEIEKLGS